MYSSGRHALKGIALNKVRLDQSGVVRATACRTRPIASSG